MGRRNTFRAEQQTNLGATGLRARLSGSQRNSRIPLQKHGFLGAPIRALHCLERPRYWYQVAAAWHDPHAVRQRRAGETLGAGGVVWLREGGVRVDFIAII